MDSKVVGFLRENKSRATSWLIRLWKMYMEFKKNYELVKQNRFDQEKYSKIWRVELERYDKHLRWWIVEIWKLYKEMKEYYNK